MQIELHEYRPDDLEAMHRLDVHCFDPAFRFSRRAMQRFAESPQAVTVLAHIEGELAGFAIAQVAECAGYIVTIDVTHSRRRTGLGRTLMQELERRSSAAGAAHLMLHVHTANIAAIALYEALGYTRTGTARSFYAQDLDALAYRKQLGVSG